MAFGTKFPPKFSYPSKVHRYKPLSIPALQTCAGAGPAVADVPRPSAIATAKHTNAQAKARELIIVLVNFVFIVLVSFCLSFLVVLAFLISTVPPSFRTRGLWRAKEKSFPAVHRSTWQDLAARYAEKTETLRASDKGRPIKQKETPKPFASRRS
jgi:hypothetical protein